MKIKWLAADGWVPAANMTPPPPHREGNWPIRRSHFSAAQGPGSGGSNWGKPTSNELNITFNLNLNLNKNGELF